MLSTEEGELLTRVGPGTVMGNLLREYWLPVLPSEDLPEADGRPVRVRLLGEDLIAFRATSGQVGLIANSCPHRGASLFFGRNEQDGLRCVYHGWKFDTAGACVDMPNEPAESNFKDKIAATVYATQERGGIIWAYMSPSHEPPELPALEWNLLPPDQVSWQIRLQECNWVQAVEGGIDSSHASFLHAEFGPNPFRKGPSADLMTRDRHPRFEVVDTDFGSMIGARRGAGDEQDYWRITPFLMPFYTIVPGGSGAESSYSGHAWVPIDDDRTLTWTISWNPSKPLPPVESEPFGFGADRDISGVLPPTTEPGGRYRPIANAGNDYLLDPELQRTRLFCGISNSKVQDQAIQESMGAIYNRTQEHLGSSDTGIIQARRRWLNAATALAEQGESPPGVRTPAAYLLRSLAILLPRDANWVEEALRLAPVNAQARPPVSAQP
jgi:phthalate 4,5-dioxygenase oxygenase subunit